MEDIRTADREKQQPHENPPSQEVINIISGDSIDGDSYGA